MRHAARCASIVVIFVLALIRPALADNCGDFNDCLPYIAGAAAVAVAIGLGFGLLGAATLIEGGAAAAAEDAIGGGLVRRVFYSGGEAALNAATEAAAETGGETILDTGLGQAAQTAQQAMEANGAEWAEIRQAVWEPASQAYADNAEGMVTAFVNNTTPSSIWSEVEFPALLANPNITELSVHYMQGAASLTEELWFAMSENWASGGSFFP